MPVKHDDSLDTMVCYAKINGANLTALSGITFTKNADVPGIKKVIFSGDKTIILWDDKTKTIVSCGENDNYDHYAGFCAAVVKKLYGSTSKAKKILHHNMVDQNANTEDKLGKYSANDLAEGLERIAQAFKDIYKEET